MTAKQIKMWLIALGLLVVTARIVWQTYVGMAQERCQEQGGVWDGETRVCQTGSP